jgi:hypothetical protein
MATNGRAKIRNVKSIEIKVIAMPAKADKSAARGVTRRTYSAIKAPAISITPLRKQATRPTFQAKTGSLVSCTTGTMMKKTNANRLTVLMPYGNAVMSSRPVSRASRRACQA